MRFWTWQSPCSFHDQRSFRGKPSRLRVFASDLSLEAVADLKLDGIDTLQLDVTNAESVQRAVEQVEQLRGELTFLCAMLVLSKSRP